MLCLSPSPAHTANSLYVLSTPFQALECPEEGFHRYGPTALPTSLPLTGRCASMPAALWSLENWVSLQAPMCAQRTLPHHPTPQLPPQQPAPQEPPRQQPPPKQLAPAPNPWASVVPAPPSTTSSCTAVSSCAPSCGGSSVCKPARKLHFPRSTSEISTSSDGSQDSHVSVDWPADTGRWGCPVPRPPAYPCPGYSSDMPDDKRKSSQGASALFECLPEPAEPSRAQRFGASRWSPGEVVEPIKTHRLTPSIPHWPADVCMVDLELLEGNWNGEMGVAEVIGSDSGCFWS